MPTQSDNSIVRGSLTKTNDKGDQQKVKFTGRHGEAYGGSNDANGVPVLQDYGTTAHRPKGTLLHTITPDGNPDKAMVIGGHSKYRPKDLAEGEIKDYDMWGHFFHRRQDGWHLKIGGCDVMFGDNGVITMTATTVNIIADCHLGGFGGILAAKLGSTDDDTETNGSDAITGNVAAKVWVT